MRSEISYTYQHTAHKGCVSQLVPASPVVRRSPLLPSRVKLTVTQLQRGFPRWSSPWGSNEHRSAVAIPRPSRRWERGGLSPGTPSAGPVPSGVGRGNRMPRVFGIPWSRRCLSSSPWMLQVWLPPPGSCSHFGVKHGTLLVPVPSGGGVIKMSLRICRQRICSGLDLWTKFSASGTGTASPFSFQKWTVPSDFPVPEDGRGR